jgi:AcrR family transcriptional regulator
MTDDKPGKISRGEPVRQRVLDAAERLLRDGRATYSMRDLATEAGVSFVTPFNHFGGKAAIMHALSALRIDAMIERFKAAPAPRDLMARVCLAVELAVTVMLEQPEVNRAVLSWIGMAGPSPGQVLAHSTALWALATQAEEVPSSGDRSRDVAELSVQLALGFRGVLSFWTAGEIADEELAPAAQAIAATLVAGFRDRRHGAGRREQ